MFYCGCVAALHYRISKQIFGAAWLERWRAVAASHHIVL
jgi:hypothetical protein